MQRRFNRQSKLIAWLEQHPRARGFLSLFTVGPRICRTPFLEDEFPILGVSFDCGEWEWGVDIAAARANANGIVPQCLILWELMKVRYLPLHYWLLVPVVRVLFHYGIVGKCRHRAPRILTIGAYGIEYRDPADETWIPF